MTKAALFTLGLAALLGFPAAVPAQDNSAIGAATTEAVMRQANTIVLRQKLSDARATAQRGDIPGAAKLYQESCTLVQQIGSGIDAETTQAVAGLTATRLALARDAQGRQDLREAQTQVQQVLNTEKDLKVAPNLAEVLAFKKQNDQMLAAMNGRMPSTAALDTRPQVAQQQVEAGTLVQDGKLFYEMGKLPEAEVKLYEALKLDPDNSAAYYYLNLIKQAEISRDFAQHTVDTQKRMENVEKQWVLPTAHPVLPVPNPYATNNLVYTGPGRQAIVAKLDHTRLDNFTTGEGMPLSEVLRNLSEQAKLRDPERKGINFLINPNADKSGQAIAAPANTGFGGGFGAGNAGGAFGGGAGAMPGVPGAGAAVDPATGLPVAPAANAGGGGGGEAADIGAYMIKIPSLVDVRLAEVLDAICLVSDHPLKYSIQDFAVVFQAKGEEQVVLSMRTFKVDPNTFYSGLESVSSSTFGSVNNSGSSGGSGGGNSGGNSGGGQNQNNGAVVGVVNAFSGAGALRNTGQNGGGGGGGGQTGGAVNPLNGGAGGAQGGGGNVGGQGGLNYITQVTLAATPSEAARAFFTALGVNLMQPAGKSVFFNDRLGLLFVKATETDLDTIERAIQTMNQIAQEVHIKARFIEVQQSDNKAMGFDWYLGQFNLGNNVVGTGGTTPSLNVPTSAANPLGAFPGNTAASLVPAAATDQQLFSSGSSAPTVATLTGILTDPNFQVAMHMLQSRTGYENLAEPEATTISGRQTQMRATEVVNVVTGFSFNNGTTANNANANTINGGTGGSVVNQAGVAAVTPNTQPVETGPILDVVPYILSDGYTINMSLIPSYTEFNGYDTIAAGQIPGYVPGTSLGNLNGTTLPVALPRFTVRQVVTTVNVWDNQTVVLGGLISSTVQNTKNQLPVIGDIPLLGRLFQNQSKTATKQNLMIFVTATIIDPAGNRVHTDDDLPFAQTAIPPQPPGAGQATVTTKQMNTLPPANP
jgi:type II secretory pathway component GspD/PulD (secretin)/tetratricopeptide (TPR) repeat protein